MIFWGLEMMVCGNGHRTFYMTNELNTLWKRRAPLKCPVCRAPAEFNGEDARMWGRYYHDEGKPVTGNMPMYSCGCGLEFYTDEPGVEKCISCNRKVVEAGKTTVWNVDPYYRDPLAEYHATIHDAEEATP